jgi:hypothetical protein
MPEVKPVLKAAQLAIGDLDAQFIQKLSQVLAGDAQLLRQAEGRGAGNPTFRGRSLDLGFHIFFIHAIPQNVSTLNYRPTGVKNQGVAGIPWGSGARLGIPVTYEKLGHLIFSFWYPNSAWESEEKISRL